MIEFTDLVKTRGTKRAFQIAEYSFTSLPQKTADLFEAAPPTPSAAKP
jgi:hypothetical protein